MLLQESGGQWRPVAYASRSMTETEQRYMCRSKRRRWLSPGPVKSFLIISCRQIDIETDHKPLVPLLMSKQLDSLPPRVLRFHLCMDRYTYSIYHVPGKNLYAADTLSRAPLSTTEQDKDLEELAELLMDTHLQQLPASSKRLEIYRTAQQCDTTCSKVTAYCLKGWPDRHKLTADLKPYWLARGDQR